MFPPVVFRWGNIPFLTGRCLKKITSRQREGKATLLFATTRGWKDAFLEKIIIIFTIKNWGWGARADAFLNVPGLAWWALPPLP